jgi:23S rRNA (adenine2503-C2)-methyltransferase
MKKNIRELKLSDLENILNTLEEPSYRSRQIFRWLWKERVSSFNQMSNISNKCKEYLKNNFAIKYTQIDNKIKSNDGTIKFLFTLPDGKKCEGVLIPENQRITACVSSQVGCSFSCKFCATGKMKRTRNIFAFEIYDQVTLMMEEAKKNFDNYLTNIVYMGMGEPLVNYQNVIESINYIVSKDGLNMSSKRITVSTVGVSKMIKKLADDNIKVNLAVSLHSANNIKRSQIMDINHSNNLDDLRDSLIYFYSKTKIKITYEYVMLKDFNDSKQDAIDLAEFSKIIPSKINLIEFNSVENSNFKKTSEQVTKEFISLLKKKNIVVNLRRSRGEDVNAACGQLANLTDK